MTFWKKKKQWKKRKEKKTKPAKNIHKKTEKRDDRLWNAKGKLCERAGLRWISVFLCLTCFNTWLHWIDVSLLCLALQAYARLKHPHCVLHRTVGQDMGWISVLVLYVAFWCALYARMVLDPCIYCSRIVVLCVAAWFVLYALMSSYVIVFCIAGLHHCTGSVQPYCVLHARMLLNVLCLVVLRLQGCTVCVYPYCVVHGSASGLETLSFKA